MKIYAIKDKIIQEDVIKEAIRNFVGDTKENWNYITPPELMKKGTNKYFLLDLRMPEDFKKGHIKEAHNIFWLDLFDNENLKRLPKNKPILLVCYVGHSASQTMVCLRLLGYDVTTLKFGMGISPVEGVPVAGWTDYGFEVVEGKE